MQKEEKSRWEGHCQTGHESLEDQLGMDHRQGETESYLRDPLPRTERRRREGEVRCHNLDLCMGRQINGQVNK